MFNLKNYQDISSLDFLKVCDCKYCSSILVNNKPDVHPEFPCYWIGDSFVLRFSADYRSRKIIKTYYRECPQRYFHSDGLPGERAPDRVSIEYVMSNLDSNLSNGILFNLDLFC